MDSDFKSAVDNFKPRWFRCRLNSPSYRNPSAENVSDELSMKKQPLYYSAIVPDGKQKIPPFDAGDDIQPLQQSDLMKPLLLDIGRYGLNYAFEKNYDHPNAKVDNSKYDKYKYTKTKHSRRVVIIGAGPAGLAAGYELKRVGHDVVILEMQHRVGGRVKTISDSHFYPGLWSDAGAMRLPGRGDPDTQPKSEASHYMVDFYAGKEKFNLPIIPFINECEFGYYKFYGTEQITMKEWNYKDNPKIYSDKYWPGWDKTIKNNTSNWKEVLPKENVIVNGIGDYFSKTVNPIIGQLYKWISKMDDADAWDKWVQKWSRFSVNDFLTSTLEQIKLKLAQTLDSYDSHEDDNEDLKVLQFLLPWPIEAVVAFTTFSYIVDLDVSLVELLRDTIGKWWKPPMHTFKEGLQMLPWSFVKFEENGGFEGDDMDLAKCVVFGAKAHTIKYTAGTAIVTYNDQGSGKDVECVGDAVIITLPVHIIRQLKFNPPLPPYYYSALENISYSPSTKILLQCRERFWEREGINGGFSKTNMPIGQLHYPSNPEFKIPSTDRGILMCYTWKQEALLFGSQSPKDAIAEAVREIEEIHPNIREYFEVGAVQAWYSDPTSQGAFGLLKPMQYLATEFLIDQPILSVYFAGEALSTTNGWIQGALVSGLGAAFNFYTDNEILFR